MKQGNTMTPCAHPNGVCAYLKRCADKGLAPRCAYLPLSRPPHPSQFHPIYRHSLISRDVCLGFAGAAPLRAQASPRLAATQRQGLDLCIERKALKQVFIDRMNDLQHLISAILK